MSRPAKANSSGPMSNAMVRLSWTSPFSSRMLRTSRVDTRKRTSESRANDPCRNPDETRGEFLEETRRRKRILSGGKQTLPAVEGHHKLQRLNVLRCIRSHIIVFRSHQPPTAHRTESGEGIDDRFTTICTLFNVFRSAVYAEYVFFCERDEIPALGTQLKPGFLNKRPFRARITLSHRHRVPLSTDVPSLSRTVHARIVAANEVKKEEEEKTWGRLATTVTFESAHPDVKHVHEPPQSLRRQTGKSRRF